ncbi:hypothetical protein NIES2111_53840 [Nostoc sp. NIES-2111]|nr:hypothetical protein NIES2111_53840 [Nostoc sp. NIES-2111]
MINLLTPEQRVLIPSYLGKWRNILLSSEPIDRKKAEEVIESLYSLVGKKTPKLIFCNSPYTAGKEMLLLKANQEKLEANLVDDLEIFVKSELRELVRRIILEKDLAGSIDTDNLFMPLSQVELDDLDYELVEYHELDLIDRQRIDLVSLSRSVNQSELVWQLWSKKINAQAISSFDWFVIAAKLDFFVSEIHDYYDPKLYQFVENVVRAGIIIFPFEDCCFVCDRPTKISFDNENLFHAEGEPALQFADGQSFYFYHGVTLPEKYGKVHPPQWQAQWLLTETNAELRRVIIQGIGYVRICQELQAVELDNWTDYTLLQIDNPIDVEPIYLLKMTCPSTGFVHVLRVPPQTKSAREAICWVNWGVDPEDFSLQT